LPVYSSVFSTKRDCCAHFVSRASTSQLTSIYERRVLLIAFDEIVQTKNRAAKE